MKPTAEYSLPSTFTPQKREELFEEIVRLYDLADDIMAAVAKENLTNRNEQLEIAKPYVNQIVNTANILTSFYTEVARGTRPITADLQDTFETALSNVFHAFTDFLDGAEAKLIKEKT